jgi:hypothetical protein
MPRSIFDSPLKNPTSALREAMKGLNVLNVRLNLASLARLEFVTFYGAI